MKIAFISDIHGNAFALEEVLRDIRQKSVDKIMVLGDICYRGPEPKKSLQLVRGLHTDVIKGNADEWVVRGVQQGEVPDKVIDMMNRERDWTVSRLELSDLDYLNQLPTEMNFQVNDVAVHVFHATPNSLFDIVPPFADDDVVKSKLMSSSDSQIYVYGHIHKPYIRYIEGKMVINTGSVGLPFDGLAMASYATVEIREGTITSSIERVHYDIEKTAEEYQTVAYPNAAMLNVLRNAKI